MSEGSWDRRSVPRPAAFAFLVIVVVAGAGLAGLALTAKPAPRVRVVPAVLAARTPDGVVVAGAVADVPADGAIATSTDGGRTWTVRRSGTPPINGIAIAGDRVLITTDCTSPQGPDCMWRSFDGGATFAALPSVPQLRRPGLTAAGHGWALSSNTLWLTSDSGTSWAQTTPSCLGSGQTAVAIGYDGATWAYEACAGYSDRPKDKAVYRIGPEFVGTAAMRTAEFGVGSEGALPASGVLEGVSMLRDGWGWLWTTEGLYESRDGGVHWSSVAVRIGIVDAVRTDHDRGYAILAQGDRRAVSRTTDAGRNWTNVSGL